MSGKSGPLIITQFGPAASVALSVVAAHALGLTDTWWAAISAFVVMQESLRASFYRGFLRIAGSAVGAAIAFVAGPALGSYPLIFVPFMGLVTWVGLIGAVVYSHGYAWVLAVVTFVMVMCEAVGPNNDFGHFAQERVTNVVVGTAACIVVAAVIEIVLGLRHDLSRNPRPTPPQQTATHIDPREAMIHALPGGLAIALLAGPASLWQLDAVTQGMVTTIAVLVVPLDHRSGLPRVLVIDRMYQRIAGCLVAGALAFLLFPLIENQPILCQAALITGVLAGTVAQTRFPTRRYAAMQFVIAFIMVFVQDQGWTVDEEQAFGRLAGVLVGIATLYLLYAAVQRFVPKPN
ncbi:MAG: FUSC family protein [Mesorhizobium sp.]|nr:FUSC family protein [Mesorhizobium sp.]MBL8579523.1 FUSC family protein [Mesorhizobium sp.]